MLKLRAIIASSLSVLTAWPYCGAMAQQSLATQTLGPTRISRPGSHLPADYSSSPAAPAQATTSASAPASGPASAPASGPASTPKPAPAPRPGQKPSAAAPAVVTPAGATPAVVHPAPNTKTNRAGSGGMPAPAPPPALLNAHGSADKSGLVPLKPQLDAVQPPAPPPAFLNAAPGPSAAANTSKNLPDQYPAIGNLELVTLGQVDPGSPIEHRLAHLETAVFNKTFQYDSLFDRTERLKKIILGTQEIDPNSAAARDLGSAAGGVPRGSMGSGWIDNPHPALETTGEVHYLDEQAALPENQQPVSAADLSAYAVALINRERQSYGLVPLTSDLIGDKLAQEHTADQARRSVLTHFSSKGDNPDRRMTLLESTDCVTESIASVKVAELGVKRVCKAAAARILKVLLTRQDDRDALLSPDATHIGFAGAMAEDGDKIIGTAEILTRRAIISPTPAQVTVGDKVEVKGVLHAPYYFDKVTLAWEAYSPETAGGSTPDDADEALPYFPPLDYVAYSSKAERDYDKAILALKTVGMVAAVAGGLFIPPVALAAPLIAVAGSGGEPKPVSDIPVKGGIKVDGAAFSGHIPLSNANKEGLYYVTVWASLGRGQKPVAVSRRVILAKASAEQASEAHDKANEKAREEQAKLDKELEKSQRKAQERQDRANRKAEKAGRPKTTDKTTEDKEAGKTKSTLDVEGQVEPANSLPANSPPLNSLPASVPIKPGASTSAQNGGAGAPSGK